MFCHRNERRGHPFHSEDPDEGNIGVIGRNIGISLRDASEYPKRDFSSGMMIKWMAVGSG
jgi:hypothetical protein